MRLFIMTSGVCRSLFGSYLLWLQVCVDRCLDRGKTSGRTDDNKESLNKRSDNIVRKIGSNMYYKTPITCPRFIRQSSNP